MQQQHRSSGQRATKRGSPLCAGCLCVSSFTCAVGHICLGLQWYQVVMLMMGSRSCEFNLTSICGRDLGIGGGVYSVLASRLGTQATPKPPLFITGFPLPVPRRRTMPDDAAAPDEPKNAFTVIDTDMTQEEHVS